MNLSENNNTSKNLNTAASKGPQSYGSKSMDDGKFGELKAQLGDVAKHGMEDIEETLDAVKGYASNVTEFIKKRPVAILLGAVAIGAAAAFIGSRVQASNKKSVGKRASI